MGFGGLISSIASAKGLAGFTPDDRKHPDDWVSELECSGSSIKAALCQFGQGLRIAVEAADFVTAGDRGTASV